MSSIPGMNLEAIGPDAAALWVLVGLELLFMAALRHGFRRHHGG